MSVLKALGVKIKIRKSRNEVVIVSRGRFQAPRHVLNMNESGTSARVLMGLLAAQPFASIVTGSPSLLKRPMVRVIEPLEKMGAKISGKGKKQLLPVRIKPCVLRGISWEQKIASAQVKSAILLAGLFAQGPTRILEKNISRDHTERMLKCFGAPISFSKGKIECKSASLVSPGCVDIPADISSAAFFIAACLLVPGSKLLIRHLGVNPTRMGMVRVFKNMGAKIRIKNRKVGCEPVADMVVQSSSLQGCRIRASEIPSLIDELPILMVAACLAQGKTVIEGIEELRVKETDRIQSMVWNLRKAGADIQVKTSGKREDVLIQGVKSLRAGHFRSFGDHRTAMSMFTASLAASGTSTLDDISCVAKSFPEFVSVFKHLLV